MIEKAIKDGLIEEGTQYPNSANLELMLEVIDARFSAGGAAPSARDLCCFLLAGLQVDADDVTALEAYVVGFKGGLIAHEFGMDRNLFDLDICNESKGVGQRYSSALEEAEAVTREETAEPEPSADDETAEPVGR